MVRKKGLGLLAGIVVLILGFFAIFSDKLLEGLIERAGSAIIGARVELSGLDLSLLSSRLTWNSLHVANPTEPMRNLFETGFVDLDLDLEPLIYKRVVIEEMRLDSLRFDTPRSRSGAIGGRGGARSTATVDSVKHRLEEELRDIPLYDIATIPDPDIDSILAAAKLRTPALIDSLSEKLDDGLASWDRRMKRLIDREDITRLKRDIDAISIPSSATHTVLAEKARRFEEVVKKLDSLREESRRIREDIEGTAREFREYRRLLERAVRRDKERLRELTRLPSVNAATIERVLFGTDVIRRIQSALNYIGIARYYNRKVQAMAGERDPQPARLKGQDIRFSNRLAWPRFWIKHGSLSAYPLAEILATGKVENIVAGQNIIGLPMTIDLSATRSDEASLSLSGLFDYTGEKPTERIGMEARNLPLAGIELFSSPFIPPAFAGGRGGFDGTVAFIGPRFSAEGAFRGSNLSFVTDTADMSGEAAMVVRQAIARSVKSLTVTAKSNNDDDFRFSISSDIASVAMNALAQRGRKRIAQAEGELLSRFEESVTGEKQSLLERLDTRLYRFVEAAEEENRLFGEISSRLNIKREALQERMKKRGLEKALEKITPFGSGPITPAGYGTDFASFLIVHSSRNPIHHNKELLCGQ